MVLAVAAAAGYFLRSFEITAPESERVVEAPGIVEPTEPIEPIESIDPMECIESTPSQEIVAPEIDVEAATDKLIAQIDEQFARFKSLMMPKINIVADPRLRAELMGPIDVMDINRENPNRNAPRFDRESLAAGNEQTVLANPYYFTLRSSAKLPPGLAASFTPPSRCMDISSNFDGNNIIDMFIIYHELRHVVMDSNIRRSLPPAQAAVYLEEFIRTAKEGGDKRKNMIVSDEIFAYGFELEMLDLYLDGELKRAYSNGRVLFPADVLYNLNGRPDQLGIVTFLLELATFYYPEGIKADPGGGRIYAQRRFMDAVAKKAEEKGFRPIVFDPVKGYSPYKKAE